MYRCRLINDSFGRGFCFGLRVVLKVTDAFGIEDGAYSGQRAAIHCLQRLAPLLSIRLADLAGDRRILSGTGHSAKTEIYESCGAHRSLNW